METNETLLLQNQLCFPLYSAANTITRKYKPLLNKLGLTYTQYIVMMVLWEEGTVNEKTLVKRLYLKSSTLTPLLKRLEEKGYISIGKDPRDNRNIVISLTEKGQKLKEDAACVPSTIVKEMHLDEEEAKQLYRILYKIIGDEKQ